MPRSRWKLQQITIIHDGNHVAVYTGNHLIRALDTDPTRTHQPLGKNPDHDMIMSAMSRDTNVNDVPRSDRSPTTTTKINNNPQPQGLWRQALAAQALA